MPRKNDGLVKIIQIITANAINAAVDFAKTFAQTVMFGLMASKVAPMVA